MSQPFPEQVTPGGILVYPQIQSPNFVHDVSGWQVARDGSAEFNDVTIRGGQVIGGTSLYYNGTPAANNLVASISAVPGTDAFGNDYLAGEVTYHFTAVGPSGSLAVAVDDAGITWYSAASGTLGPWTQIASVNSFNVVPGLFVSAPAFKFSSGVDGNAYTLGHLIRPSSATPASPQTINNTSAALITGCQAPVGVAAYQVKAIVQYVGQQAAGTPNFQLGLSGGAAASVLWGNAVFHDAVAGTSGYVARPTAWSPFGGPVLSTNNWMVTIDGYALFTAGGTVALQAWTSLAADTFEILNAVLDLIPV